MWDWLFGSIYGGDKEGGSIRTQLNNPRQYKKLHNYIYSKLPHEIFTLDDGTQIKGNQIQNWFIDRVNNGDIDKLHNCLFGKSANKDKFMLEVANIYNRYKDNNNTSEDELQKLIRGIALSSSRAKIERTKPQEAFPRQKIPTEAIQTFIKRKDQPLDINVGPRVQSFRVQDSQPPINQISTSRSKNTTLTKETIVKIITAGKQININRCKNTININTEKLNNPQDEFDVKNADLYRSEIEIAESKINKLEDKIPELIAKLDGNPSEKEISDVLSEYRQLITSLDYFTSIQPNNNPRDAPSSAPSLLDLFTKANPVSREPVASMSVRNAPSDKDDMYKGYATSRTPSSYNYGAKNKYVKSSKDLNEFIDKLIRRYPNGQDDDPESTNKLNEFRRKFARDDGTSYFGERLANIVINLSENTNLKKYLKIFYEFSTLIESGNNGNSLDELFNQTQKYNNFTTDDECPKFTDRNFDDKLLMYFGRIQYRNVRVNDTISDLWSPGQMIPPKSARKTLPDINGDIDTGIPASIPTHDTMYGDNNGTLTNEPTTTPTDATFIAPAPRLSRKKNKPDPTNNILQESLTSTQVDNTAPVQPTVHPNNKQFKDATVQTSPSMEQLISAANAAFASIAPKSDTTIPVPVSVNDAFTQMSPTESDTLTSLISVKKSPAANKQRTQENATSTSPRPRIFRIVSNSAELRDLVDKLMGSDLCENGELDKFYNKYTLESYTFIGEWIVWKCYIDNISDEHGVNVLKIFGEIDNSVVKELDQFFALWNGRGIRYDSTVVDEMTDAIAIAINGGASSVEDITKIFKDLCDHMGKLFKGHVPFNERHKPKVTGKLRPFQPDSAVEPRYKQPRNNLFSFVRDRNEIIRFIKSLIVQFPGHTEGLEKFMSVFAMNDMSILFGVFLINNLIMLSNNYDFDELIRVLENFGRLKVTGDGENTFANLLKHTIRFWKFARDNRGNVNYAVFENKYFDNKARGYIHKIWNSRDLQVCYTISLLWTNVDPPINLIPTQADGTRNIGDNESPHDKLDNSYAPRLYELFNTPREDTKDVGTQTLLDIVQPVELIETKIISSKDETPRNALAVDRHLDQKRPTRNSIGTYIPNRPGYQLRALPIPPRDGATGLSHTQASSSQPVSNNMDNLLKDARSKLRSVTNSNNSSSASTSNIDVGTSTSGPQIPAGPPTIISIIPSTQDQELETKSIKQSANKVIVPSTHDQTTGTDDIQTDRKLETKNIVQLARKVIVPPPIVEQLDERITAQSTDKVISQQHNSTDIPVPLHTDPTFCLPNHRMIVTTDDIEKQGNEIKESFDKLSELINTSLGGNNKLISQEFESHAKDFERVTQQLNDMRTHTVSKEDLNALNVKYSSLYSGIADALSRIEQIVTDINKQSEANSSTLTVLNDNVKSNNAAQLAEVNKLKRDISTELTRIEKDGMDAIKGINSRLEKLAKNIQDNSNAHSDALIRHTESIGNKVDQLNQHIKDDIDGIVERLNSLDRNTNDSLTKINNSLSLLDKSVGDNITDIRNLLNTLIVEVRNGFADNNIKTKALDKTIKDSVADIIGRLDKLDTLVNDGLTKIDKLTETTVLGFTGVNTRLDSTDTQLGALSGATTTGFADVNKQLGDTNTRLDLLDNTTTTGFDNVNKQLEALGNTTTDRFTGINEQLGALSTMAADGFIDVNTRLGDTNTRIDDTNTRITDTNAQLGKLNTITADGFIDVNTRLGELSGTTTDGFADINKQLGDTNTQLNSLGDTTATGFRDVNTGLSDTNKQINATNTILGNTNAQLGALNTITADGFTGVNMRLDNTHTLIDDTKKRITDTNTQLGALNTITADGFTGVNTGLGDINRRIDTTNEQLGRLSTTTADGLTDVNRKLDNTHIRIDDTNTLLGNTNAQLGTLNTTTATGFRDVNRGLDYTHIRIDDTNKRLALLGNENATGFTNVTEQLAAINKAFLDNNEKVESMNASIRTNNERLDVSERTALINNTTLATLKDAVDGIGRKVNTLETVVDRANNDNANILDRVVEATNNLTAVVRELRDAPTNSDYTPTYNQRYYHPINTNYGVNRYQYGAFT